MLEQGNFEHASFPSVAKNAFGIDAVEYVNRFFADKATDYGYLRELRGMCEHLGVESRLIMIDGEGALGAAEQAERRSAVEKHKKWVIAAWVLGCASIRVNAHGSGTPEQQQEQAAESLRALASYADPYGIDVIVENHGGLSSNGKWLAGVMLLAGHPRVGTLPDFGNFHIGGDEHYDRYEGVRELMPWAKAVSAKSYAFDDEGNETTIDYRRMMKIVLDAGYRGYVGIEYEGDKHAEPDGVKLTKALLERVRDELAREHR
jgi:sugar phosphate isomerase/epimerase